jgi:hypothetical protein
MAIRMQQRRGTASQWTTANPILNAGEIGFETDTNKFKIGDGTNHWADLDYFIDEAGLGTTLGDYVETSLLASANGVATLNSSGKLETSQVPDLAQVTVHAVANQTARLALSVQVGDIAIQSDNGQTYVLSATPASTNGNWTPITVADPFPSHDTDDLTEGSSNLYYTTARAKTDAASLLTNATLTNITITGNGSGLTITAENGVADSTTDNLSEGSTNKYFTDERAQDAVGNAVGTGLTYNDGTGAISVTANTYDAYGSASTAETNAANALSSHASDTTSIHGIADTSKIVFTDSASTTLDGDLTVDGDFTVNGTNFAASATSITIEDNMVQLAHGNSANTVDLGLVVGYTESSTAKHAGIVRDVSADKWKLFKGVTTEPATTVDFTQGSLDDLEVAGLTASSITVGDVSNTEFGYLNGVTSAIQTQLDAKLETSTASSTYAPIASPTFTGTVTVPNDAILGTPTSITLTNATGLPVSTGISGLGTGIATALAVNTGSAGAPVLFNGALGTPSSGTLTNATGLPLTSGVTGTLPIANGGTGQTTAAAAANALLPSQTSNAGKYLTTDGSGTLSWGTVSGYSAPTIGSTSIASGATVTTLSGLTDVVLNGPGSIADELSLLMMGAL